MKKVPGTGLTREAKRSWVTEILFKLHPPFINQEEKIYKGFKNHHGAAHRIGAK
jgi:transcription initiation factor IIF auxiliary subunit